MPTARRPPATSARNSAAATCVLPMPVSVPVMNVPPRSALRAPPPSGGRAARGGPSPLMSPPPFASPRSRSLRRKPYDRVAVAGVRRRRFPRVPVDHLERGGDAAVPTGRLERGLGARERGAAAEAARAVAARAGRADALQLREECARRRVGQRELLHVDDR